MSMTDPIGDLITRIRNAQQRAKSKVSTPASKLRERVLEVLKTEGYIRGYATVAHSDGRSEIEIASTRRCGRCRASTTASASRSCRRRRA
jgi:small subunit ribosomal protein S8